MPQVLPSPKQAAKVEKHPVTDAGWLVMLYLLLVLLPPALKLSHLTRVANCSWGKVTFFLWGPWLVVIALGLVMLAARVIERLRGRG